MARKKRGYKIVKRNKRFGANALRRRRLVSAGSGEVSPILEEDFSDIINQATLEAADWFNSGSDYYTYSNEHGISIQTGGSGLARGSANFVRGNFATGCALALGARVVASAQTVNHTLLAATLALSNRAVVCVASVEWAGASGVKPTDMNASYGGVDLDALPAGQKGQVDREGDGGGIWVYVLLEADLPADGVRAFTINPDNACQGNEVYVRAFENVRQSGISITTAQSAGGAAALSPADDYDDAAVVVAVNHSNGSGTWTGPANWTEDRDVDTGGGDCHFSAYFNNYASDEAHGGAAVTFTSTNVGAGKCSILIELQSLIAFPASPGLRIDLPESLDEYWAEFDCRLSTTFDVAGTGVPGANEDYKFMFFALQPGDGRNQLKIGNGGNMATIWPRYNAGPDTEFITADNDLNSGEWFRVRVHCKLQAGNNCIFTFEFWDGVNDPITHEEFVNFELAEFDEGMNYILWGANRNRPSLVPATHDLGYFAVYDEDPNWGI